jgi:hypothetical protein
LSPVWKEPAKVAKNARNGRKMYRT